MRLTDIMGQLGLSFYPQVGLIIFLVVFGAIVLRVFSPGRKSEFSRGVMLPLESDDTTHLSGKSS